MLDEPLRHPGLLLFVIVSLAVIVASCAGPPPPALSDLKALPEAGLAPPGAVHVSRNERDAERTISGPAPAILGDVMATTRRLRDAILTSSRAEASGGWCAARSKSLMRAG
jgi:hypothetical protein